MTQQQPLNRLQVPIDDSDPKEIEKDRSRWKMILDPQEIIRALISRNIKHFGGASGTPFMTDPLQEIFGYTAEEFRERLKDQKQSLMLHKSTEALLNQITSETLNVTITESISMEQMKHRLSNWRESTSTSPSGQHLGHWRALAVSYEDRTEKEDADEIRK